MRETRTLEFKETITSFLKTVSAYANYQAGEIIFGISDDGIVKAISFIHTIDNRSKKWYILINKYYWWKNMV